MSSILIFLKIITQVGIPFGGTLEKNGPCRILLCEIV